MKFKLTLYLVFISGCATLQSKRVLNTEEKEKYHLNGIIREARICPTKFNEFTKTSEIVGKCELVTCEQITNQIVCTAVVEK